MVLPHLSISHGLPIKINKYANFKIHSETAVGDHLYQDPQPKMVKKPEIRVVRNWQQEDYVGGVGAKPPAAEGKGVWGQSPQLLKIFAFLPKKK